VAGHRPVTRAPPGYPRRARLAKANLYYYKLLPLGAPAHLKVRRIYYYWGFPRAPRYAAFSQSHGLRRAFVSVPEQVDFTRPHRFAVRFLVPPAPAATHAQIAAFGGLLPPEAAPRPVAGSGSAPSGRTPPRYPRPALWPALVLRPVAGHRPVTRAPPGCPSISGNPRPKPLLWAGFCARKPLPALWPALVLRPVAGRRPVTRPPPCSPSASGNPCPKTVFEGLPMAKYAVRRLFPTRLWKCMP